MEGNCESCGMDLSKDEGHTCDNGLCQNCCNDCN